MSETQIPPYTDLSAFVLQCIRVLREDRGRDVWLDTLDALRVQTRGNDLMKEKIGLLGAPSILVKMLQSKDLELQQMTAKLLRSISINERNRDILGRSGVIGVLIQILRTTDDFTLKLAVTASLWNLSVADKNKKIIGEQGGIPLITKSLESNNLKLQNEAVGALRNLSLDKESGKLIEKAGAIPHLIARLSSTDEKIQRNSAITLRNLSVNNDAIINLIESQCGTEFLKQIMVKHGLEYDLETTLPEGLSSYFQDFLKWDELILTKKIGEGKYGEVYKARYHDFPVACKIIKKKLTSKDAESTLEELKLMRRLRHPNVVMLIGACLNPCNQVVIVTEYLDRGNLKECLGDVQHFSLRLDIALDIANGLACLHSQHIIHRDLKLTNLLVSKDWRVKISDFGLSLDLSKAEVCRGFKGNIKYSPPEILRPHYDKTITVFPYCEKTDVYSFGLLFWELLSFKQFFPHVKCKEGMINYVMRGDRPALDARWPESVCELLTSCWHENISKRPPFVTIVKQLETVHFDLMCPDAGARKFVKRLWRSRRDQPLSYAEVERALIQHIAGPSLYNYSHSSTSLGSASPNISNANSHILPNASGLQKSSDFDSSLTSITKSSSINHVISDSSNTSDNTNNSSIGISTSSTIPRFKALDTGCLRAILCDPYDDTVRFERFCQACNWFGPLVPLSAFLARLVKMLHKPYFHGLVTTSKANELLRTHQPGRYLIRLATNELGAYSLSFVGENYDILHKSISYRDSVYLLVEFNIQFSSLGKLHQFLKSKYKLKKTVRGNPYTGIFI